MIPLYFASFFGHAEIFEFHAMAENISLFYIFSFLQNNYIDLYFCGRD
jgi:hypothetical protein